MSIINIFSEKILLPLTDIVLKRHIYKSLSFLMKSQFYTEEQIEEYQNQKLRKIIKHAYLYVPYYTKLFNSLKLKPNDIITKTDLKMIPILNKSDIKKNFDLFKAYNIPSGDLIELHSSGSTGEPFRYYTTKYAYSKKIAASLRGWYWMGYRLGDKFVKISQNERYSFEKKMQDLITRNKYMFVEDLDPDSYSGLTRDLLKYKPKFIRCYPDPLLSLAKIIDSNKTTRLTFEGIATTGNILSEDNRQKIESAFNCKIFDAYSCEGSPTYFECPSHYSYHASDETAISEIVDDEGFEVTQGQKGRLISTDITNFAMPFIRYDTKDILIKSDNNCICGRKLSSIKKIEGRDSDVIILANGRHLIVHIFTIYFAKFDSVERFQAVQDSLDSLKIYLKINSKFTKETLNEIKQYWVNRAGENVKTDIIITDDIPLSPSGKRRFIINKTLENAI